MIEALAGDRITATNEPRKIACGAPDFIISRDLLPLGYIEAKDVGVDLGRVERSEQLVRYRLAAEVAVGCFTGPTVLRCLRPSKLPGAAN